MLRYRIIIGPIMLAALVGLLWLDERLDATATPAWLKSVAPSLPETLPPGIIMLAIGVLIVSLAARELAAIFHASGILASRRWLAVAAITGLLVSAMAPAGRDSLHGVALVATAGTAVLIGSLIWHIRNRHLRGATAAAGAALLAFVYLGLTFGFLIVLRRHQSAWVVLGVLAITKSCDIGAYATGHLIGRHKLIPWLSPGKTWEGLYGGLVVSAGMAVIAVLIARYATGENAGPGSLALWQGASLGVLFALLGQGGDLLASVLKRDAGIKDSGKTIPGFGGVLDVLDSVILVAPLAFWVLADL